MTSRSDLSSDNKLESLTVGVSEIYGGGVTWDLGHGLSQRRSWGLDIFSGNQSARKSVCALV